MSVHDQHGEAAPPTLLAILCEGELVEVQVLERFRSARAVVCIKIIRALLGAGENVVFELIRKFLLLSHSVGYTQGVEKICQRFNSFMEGKLLLILDEVTAQRPDGSYGPARTDP